MICGGRTIAPADAPKRSADHAKLDSPRRRIGAYAARRRAGRRLGKCFLSARTGPPEKQQGFVLKTTFRELASEVDGRVPVYLRAFVLANFDEYGAVRSTHEASGYQITATSLAKSGARLMIHRVRDGRSVRLAVARPSGWADWQTGKVQTLTITGRYDVSGALRLRVVLSARLVGADDIRDLRSHHP